MTKSNASNGDSIRLRQRSDWVSWYGYMKAKLMRKRVWHLVNPPADAAGIAGQGAPERSIADSMMACGLILETLHQSVRKVVQDMEDPEALMKRLKDMFFRATPANLSEMLHELWTLEMPPSRRIDDAICEIDRLASDIEAQGGTIDDAHKVAILHSILRKSSMYRPLVMQFNAQGAVKVPGRDGDELVAVIPRMSYEDVCDACRVYETTLTPADYAADSGHGALIAQQRGGNKKAGGKDQEKKCRSCKEVGHWWRDCTKFPPGTCWKCGSKDHKKKECPQLTPKHSAMIAVASSVPEDFVLDSGATAHIVNRKDYLKNVKPTSQSVAGVHGGDGLARAEGNLHCFPGTALYLPGTTHNLLSVLQLGNHGWRADFQGRKATLTAPDGSSFHAEAAHNSSLYRLSSHQCFIATTEDNSSMVVWHNRLGHPSDKVLHSVCKDFVDTSQWPSELPIQCVDCVQSKLTKAPVNRSTTHEESDAKLRPGEVLHMDLIGPMEDASVVGGFYYDCQVKDRATRMLFRAPLVRKTGSATAVAVATMIDKELTPFGRVCKVIVPDRGSEFNNKDFLMMCAERGMEVKFIASDTPAHNGLVERAHRTVVTIARCLLNTAKLPGKFWSEAIEYATYLCNAMPTKGLPDSLPPFYHWTGEMPSLKNLLTFGSKVFFLSPGGRFGKTAGEGVYLGPARDTSGGAVRVWNPATERIIISRDIRIVEPAPVAEPAVIEPAVAAAVPVAPVKDASSQEEEVDSDYASDSDSSDDDTMRGLVHSDEEDEGGYDDVIEAARPHREAQIQQGNLRELYQGRRAMQQGSPPLSPPAPRRVSARIAAQAVAAVEPDHVAMISDTTVGDDSEDDAVWIPPKKEELGSLKGQDVFDVTKRIPDRRTVTTKWVLSKKTDANNKFLRRKARLTARGFSQLPGVDYDAVSAPVISKEAIRVVFAVGTLLGWQLEQFDVKTAYLHAPLDKEVYVEPPSDFLELWGDQLSPEERQILADGGVLRLNKALYGLKQSGRCWYEKLCQVMQGLGMEPTAVEPCLFVSKNSMALVHVDDGIAVVTAPKGDMERLFSALGAEFEIVRLGFPHHYTGMTIDRQDNGDIVLHQRGYIEAMAAKYAPGEHHKIIPMPFGAALPSAGPPGDIKLFREIIGSLLYTSVCTRPDITTALSILSRHMSAPTAAHVSRARGIVSYLAGTPELGIRFTCQGELQISVYCDASFAPDEDHRRSRTGYVVMVNNAPVAWKSQLQPVIAHSTAEAEYIALCDAVRDAVYIRRILEAMHVSHPQPIVVYEDNQVAKRMAEEVSTRRSKHIDIKFHYVREQVASGAVIIKDCRSADMVADILTKPLARQQFTALRQRLLPSLVQGECQNIEPLW